MSVMSWREEVVAVALSCERCGFGPREPRELTRVTVSRSDGRQFSLRACPACHEWLMLMGLAAPVAGVAEAAG